MKKKLVKAVRFPSGLAAWCVAVALMLGTQAGQAQDFLDWNISNIYLDNGRLEFEAGSGRTIEFTLEMQRYKTSNGEFPPVNLQFKLARLAGINPVTIQTFSVTTSDFGGDAFSEKTYATTLVGSGGNAANEAYIRTGDELVLLFYSAIYDEWIVPGNLDPYDMVVQYQEISGNSICCSKCVGKDQEVGLLTAGRLYGGDGDLKIQWQKSTNGADFTDMSVIREGFDLAHNAQFNPGTISQTTWYRRQVESSTRSVPVEIDVSYSNVIKVDYVDALQSPTIGTKSYSQNTVTNSFGTMTIQGNQTPAAGIQVDFRSDGQIRVLPNTVLKPNITLGISAFCGSTSGRMASVSNDVTLPASTEESLNDVRAAQGGAIGVYPNPSRGIIHLELGSAVFSGKVVVLDKFSNAVHTADIPSGDSHVTLDLSALPADTYYLKVTGASAFQKTTRIILQR
ncbi:T9SS type A sorting domain-containing protein [Fulvivirgaceae bacterium PWU5]|uniref:T9SS type A sorting domain-containing protein n=1 Tax=Dawidia cretensis TaxID=2782350 RepID=A0AAP2GVR5_9BACT|nr:T9SS type A sorting domain-containing protein [Dawidia cretensis]MBT1710985.1 T9SS type A sorting domain-containing protein [Dawidia cretensis]